MRKSMNPFFSYFTILYLLRFISWSPNCNWPLHVGLTARSKQSHLWKQRPPSSVWSNTRTRRSGVQKQFRCSWSALVYSDEDVGALTPEMGIFQPFLHYGHFYSPTWGRVVVTIAEEFKNESRKKGRWTKLMRGLGNRYEEEESTTRCQRAINEDSGQPLLKSKLVNKTRRVDRPGWWRANSKVELKKNNCSKRRFYGYQINLVQRAARRSDHPGKHRLWSEKVAAGGQTFTSSDHLKKPRAAFESENHLWCWWSRRQQVDLIISSAWDKLRKQADDTELDAVLQHCPRF